MSIGMKKIVIVPQVVVYREAINFSDKVIELINSNSRYPIFGKWKKWYRQGKRMYSVLDKSLPEDNESYIMLEKIADSFQEVIVDYTNDFGSNRYVWPDFLKNWEQVEIFRDRYEIDFFRYSYKKLKKQYNQETNLLLDYHVDEFDFNNIQDRQKNLITLNMYLNDNYDGGEICIYDAISKKIYKYKPKAGDIVIMPSGHPFYHAVKNFYKEDRYFCRIFVPYLDKVNDYDLNKKLLTEKDLIKNDLQIIKISGKEIEVYE